MKRTLFIACLLAAFTGCYTEGRVGYTAHATVTAPELVYVSPGVQVIADYDEPIFFSEGFYWRYDGGVWYRSRGYRTGWRVSYAVPVAVRRIDNPRAYVHYRAHVVRDHRDNGNHRGERRANRDRRDNHDRRDHRDRRD